MWFCHVYCQIAWWCRSHCMTHVNTHTVLSSLIHVSSTVTHLQQECQYSDCFGLWLWGSTTAGVLQVPRREPWTCCGTPCAPALLLSLLLARSACTLIFLLLLASLRILRKFSHHDSISSTGHRLLWAVCVSSQLHSGSPFLHAGQLGHSWISARAAEVRHVVQLRAHDTMHMCSFACPAATSEHGIRNMLLTTKPWARRKGWQHVCLWYSCSDVQKTRTYMCIVALGLPTLWRFTWMLPCVVHTFHTVTSAA